MPARLVLVFAIFFAISLVTNILGALIPDVVRAFQLSLALAAFLPVSFFLAYGLCSIPAGLLVERYREKPVVLLAFSLTLVGSLAFALSPTYAVALGSLFVIGVGMALLQVAINPLLRAVGGEPHFAFHSVLGQLVFGAASFLSPFLYAFLAARTAGAARQIGAIYWVFAATAVLMLALVALVRFPTVERKADETAGSWQVYGALLRRPMVIAYFLGIFAYVGTEQGLSTWMSLYLERYHHLDPRREGAQAVAWFWGLMTCGCALGLWLLRRLDSRAVLAAFALLAMALLAAALTVPAALAPWAFALTGFALSVMWSVIFSLALNSVSAHHGAFSGVLCTAIVGGAVVPWIVGALGDRVGLRPALLVLYATLAYILGIARWARPLVHNAQRVAA